MKFFILKILFIISAISISTLAASQDGLKKFVGKLSSGVVCQVAYVPAIQANSRAWKVADIKFDINGKRYEMLGTSLVSSVFDPTTNILSGTGVVDRKVVITSEVLGVGYETGTNVEFHVKINSQFSPFEYLLILQNYRNEYVFGSWVQGERSSPETFNCR